MRQAQPLEKKHKSKKLYITGLADGTVTGRRAVVGQWRGSPLDTNLRHHTGTSVHHHIAAKSVRARTQVKVFSDIDKYHR
jgi:hypothetical protein